MPISDWTKMTRKEQKELMLQNRLDRLNKLVELKAPQLIIFNEAILVAKACLPTDDISTKALIQELVKKED